jgi:hypothetical protein
MPSLQKEWQPSCILIIKKFVKGNRNGGDTNEDGVVQKSWEKMEEMTHTW